MFVHYLDLLSANPLKDSILLSKGLFSNKALENIKTELRVRNENFHQKKTKLLKKILKKYLPQSKSLLDLGCGTGQYSNLMLIYYLRLATPITQKKELSQYYL